MGPDLSKAPFSGPCFLPSRTKDDDPGRFKKETSNDFWKKLREETGKLLVIIKITAAMPKHCSISSEENVT
jgi:hypothetical protein